MRIARIELDRFGPFERASIDVPAPPEAQRGEIVIFEGPSGSGKTALLEAIACAAAAPHGDALMPPLRDVIGRLRAPDGAARLTLEGDGGTLQVSLGRGGITWPPEAPRSRITERIEASANNAEGGTAKVRWAPFAYRAHLATPVIHAQAPTEIDAPPLHGALSFGTLEPASGLLGQLLTNFDHEIARASVELRKPNPHGQQPAIARLASARRKGIERIEDALSQLVGRSIHFEFPFGQHAPRVLVDSEELPLRLLGAGMLSTLAWVSDLLVRLERVPWAAPDISPLDQDFWLILDGVDDGLHPTQERRILPILRQLFPSARLYIATHSPALVASAAHGHAFSLRPDSRHRIGGAVAAQKLEPGQSLEWVAEEIFGAETGFVDPWTRAALAAHRADINRLRRRETLNTPGWGILRERRAKLLALNEEVQSVVAMMEVPVRSAIEAAIGSSRRDDEVDE